MKSMRKIVSGETTPPILECGEAQFHAALTMEARSRTPLPPSPTTSVLQGTHMSSVSMVSVDLDQKLKLKPDFPILNKTKLPHEKSLPAHIPPKPPKKYTPVTITNDDCHYELIERSYDEVECRNNAWQTMGIDLPKHTEQVHFLFDICTL